MAAIIIHCNFFQTTHLPLGYVYVCFLNRLEEIGNPKVTAVFGKHNEKKTNLDVKLLHMTKIKIAFLPQNLESFFPNLIGFFLHNVGIKSLSKDDLKPFPKLTYIMMHGSEIEEIQNDVFEFNGKIEYLNLNKNKVKSIGLKVFNSIPNLKYLNLEKNVCVSGKGENTAQIELLKSKMKECFGQNTDPVESTFNYFSSITCPPPTLCNVTKEKETEILKNAKSELRKENANLKLKIRQLERKINTESLNCQQKNLLPADPKEIKNLKKETAALKVKVSQQEATVKSFKDELVKKIAELKFETDNSLSCKQKLDGVTKTLSEVNAKHRNYEGIPPNVENIDKMNRENCLEALRVSLTDNELCGKENKYLLNKKSESYSLRLMCDVTAWETVVSCNAVNFECLEENQKVLAVKNKDQTTVDKTKINELVVLNQHALFLPAEIDQVFPNLIRLTVTNSHLTRLNSDSLNLVNLKTLAVAANKISDIFNSDLEKLEKLENLDLSGNQIKQLRNGVFNNLVELKVLALDGNEIKEIDSELFSTNLKLQSIFLQGNQLKFIDSDILKPLNFLKIIDFSDNLCVNGVYTDVSIVKLDNIFADKCGKPAKLCCRFEKLSEKDISCRAVDFTLTRKNTKLSSVKSFDDCIAEESLIDARVVSKTSSKEVEDVTVLEIIDEKVHYLPTNLADFFIQLTKLAVVNSKLMSLSEQDFEGLSFINFIQLSNNELTSFEPDLFNELSGLQHLDISSNKLVEFPSKFFEKMNSLTFLNASRNELKKLEADLFPRRNSLDEIYFDRNSLDEIDPKIFRNLKKVKILDFTENPCIGLKYPEDIDMTELLSKATFC